MPLYRLVYSSEVKPLPEFEGKEAEMIEEIREKAAVKNKRLDVSGVLLYNDAAQELVQVLEGEESEVRSLFNAIKEDVRHSTVKVLVEGPAKQRDYAEWGMLKGGNREWKAVRMVLPQSVSGKMVATFDEAFSAVPEKLEASPIEDQPKPKPKRGLFGIFSCISAS
mmetsp:Transcript_7246/g.18509  ORF Transcript_7246/g.18509 Transcript_7246/m.18509 type:complete len:166 (-) Transcript_7246:78-575(-)|eukprot:CAMPEP_0202036236 /NCGR_PEP_ID=MMETSP0962-20130828/1421_1 /ASSEMBLY_ACC=CAM_ASM_000488 /TAXON_ID=4773 /ORGANISM="Schizochytrium aggregatum, Strain ATCC28209" /LENGTH=165 /DNA_ID=CAMNT_0048600305 /DNA_START=87 /DNA_END=584 /DNA_ORIENTATION=+